MSANDKATYQLAELDGTRIMVPITGKQMKAFKKRHEAEPDPEVEAGSANEDEQPNEDSIGDGSEADG